MKKLLLALLLLTGLAVAAQETDVRFMKEYFRVYYVMPNGIGNNVLAKANNGDWGAGMGLTLFSHNAYHIFINYEFCKFDVTDYSLAAISDHTTTGAFTAGLLYKINFTRQLYVNPKVSFGAYSTKQWGPVDNFSTQNGVVVNAGGDIDFVVAQPLRIFAGVQYTLGMPSVDTAPQYENFFGKQHQINISFGIKI